MVEINHILTSASIDQICKLLDTQKLVNKSILITGANGLIGSAIVDVLVSLSIPIEIYASGRNRQKLEARFLKYSKLSNFHVLEWDVNVPLHSNTNIHFDYIIHAASSASPQLMMSDPVGIITANINGVLNLANYARQDPFTKMVYISSGEIYGNIDAPMFSENMSGQLDHLSIRASYPMSKRAAENLCVAVTSQYNLDISIARPCHIYGPQYTASDQRVSAYFFECVKSHQNIVLKSRGEQLRTWLLVYDCAIGILSILLNGKKGEAYNVSDLNSQATIASFAQKIAKVGAIDVVFDLPTETEQKAFSPIKNAVLDSHKLTALGWHSLWTLEEGIALTISDK